jgi:hypothetical protein
MRENRGNSGDRQFRPPHPAFSPPRRLPPALRSPGWLGRRRVPQSPLCVLCAPFDPGAPGLRACFAVKPRPYKALRVPRRDPSASVGVTPGAARSPRLSPSVPQSLSRLGCFFVKCEISPAKFDLRASAGSYAHKGMHMTWMERVRNRAQKPVKTAPKTRKKSKKALNPRLPILTFGGL